MQIHLHLDTNIDLIMKKIHYLAGVIIMMLLASNLAYAKWPITKINQHPSVKQLTYLLREAHMQQGRLSQSGFPDSAVISSWDNGSWQPENNVGIRYQNGRVSRLIFYVSGIPALNYNYTYNAAGKATLIEMTLSLPGQSPQVMTRISMNYDANGNQTSLLVFERTNNVLALNSGDSLAISYVGGVPSQAIQLTYDNSATVPAWVNIQRYTSLSFAANGHPTTVVMTPWDETTNTWLTAEDVRYTNVLWNFGYAGFSTVFGGLMDVSQALFTELPLSQVDYLLGPTDYTEEAREAGNFVNQAKLTSTLTSNRVSQTLGQNWMNNAWVDDFRVVFTHVGSRITLALTEANSNGNWIPEFRESWLYDASSNLIEEKQETFIGTAWDTLSGEKHILDYTSDNRVYRWVRQSWDMMTSQFVNDDKREYYFGGFGLSTSELIKPSLKLYPNPVQTELWIDAVDSQQALLQIYAVNGQLVMQQVFDTQGANPLRVDVSTLPLGIYRVVLSSSKNTLSHSIVKH